MNTVKPISKLKGHFKDEWLLIRVIDFDKKRTLPLTGELLTHCKDRDALYALERKYKKKSLTLIMHSDERLPKGYGILL